MTPESTSFLPPYEFEADERDQVLVRLRSVLEERASCADDTAPLATANIVWRRVRPPLEMDAGSLQEALEGFVHSLGPPYVVRAFASPFYFSPIDLDTAESRLGGWLTGGVCVEPPAFDDDPEAGWSWAAELLLHLDGSPGGVRCYTAGYLFAPHAEQNHFLAATRDLLLLVALLGYD
jgi:hypothetical protein